MTLTVRLEDDLIGITQG